VGGFGYWEYKKTHPASGGTGPAGGTGSGLPPGPAAPEAPPTPAQAQQVVQNEVPSSLANEVTNLILNGKNPDLIDLVATELEKEGYFDTALLLHKRAAILRGQTTQAPGSPQAPLPPPANPNLNPQSPFRTAQPGQAPTTPFRAL